MSAGDDPSVLSLTSAERQLVDRCQSALGCGLLTALEPLSAGDSGSLVLRAQLSGRRVVLKITTDHDRLARARTERQLLADRPVGVIEAMPVLVAACDEPDLVAVVTEEGEPLPAPDRLGEEHWVEIAAFLGRLHTAPIPDLALPTGGTNPSRQDVAWAQDFWRGRGLPDVADRAVALLSQDPSEAGDVAPPATVFTHGDCHLDNLVRDGDGHLRLVDWQEVVLADGLGDLGFCCQRAEFAGGSPPRDLMLRAYADARGLMLDDDLRRALARAELSSLFLSWPPFLAYGTAEGQRGLQDRLTEVLTILDPTAA